MPPRSRSLNQREALSGSRWIKTASPQTRNVTTEHGTLTVTDDVVGNFPNPNPLKIRRSTTLIPVLDGMQFSAAPPYDKVLEFQTYPMGSGVQIAPPDPYNAFADPSGSAKAALAWKILAESNPSAPQVSMPTFIGELKDLKTLPVRVKDWGGHLLRKVALGHLTWRWAIKPMISDLQKLFTFQERCQQRINELHNLTENRKVRKRVSLGTRETKVAPTNVTLHSEGVVISGTRHRTYSIREWGSTWWKTLPNTVLPPRMSSKDLKKTQEYKLSLQNQEFITRLGITGYETLAAAWELAPWSWLIDWFLPVGDIIAACNNTLGLTWDRVCYMRTSVAFDSYTLRGTPPPAWLRISAMPYQVMVRKDRHLVSPSLAVSPSYLPFFDGGKWSILASLACLKSRDFRRS